LFGATLGCLASPSLAQTGPEDAQFLNQGKTAGSIPSQPKTSALPEGPSADPPSAPVEAAPRFSPGTMNLDLNYPGVGLRYFLSGKTAVEARAQADNGNLALGPRLYRYPALFAAASRFRPYLCMEVDYVSSKGEYSKGKGWGVGPFAGIEYSLSRHFSLQIDTGGLFLALKDRSTSLTEDDFEFTLNFGVNFYFKSGGTPP
jgi:hypothetical protein